MVRIINEQNIKYVIKFVCFLMGIQDKMTYIEEFDNPNKMPCIYVMWHGNQFCVHGMPHREKLNILISTSLDGNIVSEACKFLGYKTCRGSTGRKGAISGTLQLLERLKAGENVAIMVDGPRGPNRVVKHGAIMLARESNVPIIPVNWYSEDKTFIRFNSWDKMTTPVGPCRLLNTYGKPIYVKGKSDDEIAEEIKNSLIQLEKEAPDKYRKAIELQLWKKK